MSCTDPNCTEPHFKFIDHLDVLQTRHATPEEQAKHQEYRQVMREFFKSISSPIVVEMITVTAAVHMTQGYSCAELKEALKKFEQLQEKRQQ